MIEGDDSVFRLAYSEALTTEEFASLGLNTKIELHDRLSTASFCGNVFDEQDLVNLVDPGRILRRLGYFDVKYLNARRTTQLGLLRAYAFSIYYMYHGCPIVEAAARMLLRVSRGVYAKMDTLNYFKFAEGEQIPCTEQKMFEKFPPNQVGIGSREIVFSLFNYDYDEQIECERYLDSIHTIQPLYMPIVIAKSHPDCVTYFETCAAYEGDVMTSMQSPPRTSFYGIVAELRCRMAHVNARCLDLSQRGLSYDTCSVASSASCSCGPKCRYYDDLLVGLRQRLQLAVA